MTPPGKNDASPSKGEKRGPRRANREWKSVDPSRSTSKGARSFVVSPFARFARAHGLSVAGDALVTISLADSFFFSLDPNDARYKVALYLILTVAPFGLIAPWLGPAIDRLKGGHRYMVIASALIRAVLALFMAMNTDSLIMFPLAFGMLVMGKSYHVAKSAMIPTLVPDESRLVQANSRLSIISALAAAMAGIPGVLLLTIGGASWTLYFDVVVFLAAAALAVKIPATKVATEKANETERHELRGNNIVLAASAMGYMRAVVGFLTMLLAFELRGGVDPGPTASGVELGHRVRELTGLGRLDLTSGGSPTWHFGVVLAFTGIGGLGGAFTSPKLRAMVKEEKILAGSLAGVGIAGVLASLSGGLVGAAVIACAVGTAGAMGKQSFDAIVQRDAPEANLGRSFAKFESQFQLLWVFGAVIPVLIPIPARLGFLGLGGTAGFAAISYYLGRDPAPSVAAPRVATERLRNARFRRGPKTEPGADGEAGADGEVDGEVGADGDGETIDLDASAKRAGRKPRRSNVVPEPGSTADGDAEPGLFDQDLFADDQIFEAEPTREYVLPPHAPPTGPPPSRPPPSRPPPSRPPPSRPPPSRPPPGRGE